MRKALIPLAALVVSAVVAFPAPTFADTPANSEAAVRRWTPPPEQSPAFSFELVDATERELPTFNKSGQRFVMGSMGERYRIHVTNPSSQRVEVVVSVDGLDVLDGNDASLQKRGYVVPAFGDVTIDGWRTSQDSVAAFRFASVRDSYAARTGSSRNVGVIGVAFFRERQQDWRPRPWASGAGGSSRRSAPAPAPNTAPKDEEQRKGLGTEFGEQHDSHVNRTTFERASSSPAQLLQVRYDDREGLRAIGIQIPDRRITRWEDRDLRDTAEPFPNRRFAQPPPDNR